MTCLLRGKRTTITTHREGGLLPSLGQFWDKRPKALGLTLPGPRPTQSSGPWKHLSSGGCSQRKVRAWRCGVINRKRLALEAGPHWMPSPVTSLSPRRNPSCCPSASPTPKWSGDKACLLLSFQPFSEGREKWSGRWHRPERGGHSLRVTVSLPFLQTSLGNQKTACTPL